MLNKFASGAAASAVLLLLSGVASATSISPGQTNVPVGNTPGGVYTLLYSATQNFSFVGNTGSVVTDVVNYSANPFGAGDITFFFQITVTAGQVEHLTDASLAAPGVQLDVLQGQFNSGDSLVNGNAPSTGADLSIDGSVLSFDFSGAGAVTSSSGPSYLLIVNTNQTSWTFGSMGVIDGGAQTLQGFSFTPEPASMALALAGLPCLAFGRWLRRKK